MHKKLADELGLPSELLNGEKTFSSDAIEEIKKLLVKNFIIIPKSEYEQLQRDQHFLECLRGAGVDNWDWYDEASEQFRKENGEEEE